MRIRRTQILAIALALFALPLFGCQWHVVSVLIPDFDSSEVEGVSFWRLSEDTGDYLFAGEAVFGDQVLIDGKEMVLYTLLAANGAVIHDSLAAVLHRDETDPDQVMLKLQYLTMHGEKTGAVYRVGTYNAAGESPLSEESVLLY